jgi:O-antigen ligase
MTNEYIGPYSQNEKGMIHFLFPLIIFGISFYTLPWQVNILLFVSILLLVGKEYLFAVLAGLTFYNVMYLDAIPFWASLVSSYGALGIIILRVRVLKTKVPVSFILAILLIVLISFSFLFKTVGAYYFLTGVKSSIQLIFLILVVTAILMIPNRYLHPSKEVFDRYLVPFILSYLITGLIFFDFNDRFGAGSGAQCLALQLALLLCYCSSRTTPTRRNFQFFLLIPILFTGSRTYLILACLILAYDYFMRSPLRLKFIILANVAVIFILALIILPYTDSRFDYTSPEFAGSLWGRFRNYYLGIDLIKQHPITGNGMGSMLRVLEGWVNTEGTRYYQEKGDTTIMHNEYLRILIELGFLGLGIILLGILRIWKRLKDEGAKLMIVLFMAASLLENTLTLYTTGTLLFIILVAFNSLSSEGEK